MLKRLSKINKALCKAGKNMIILCLVIALIMTTGCAGGTAGDTDGSSDGTGNDPASEAGAGASVTEGTYSYETVEFSVPSTDGAKKDIYGVFYIPKGAGDKLPTVIFSHGYGGTHRVGVPYAEALAGQGYAVYCFDFRGGSPESRSGGSTLEMSVFTELEDLEQVIGAVEEQDFVDDENIFLMGTSQGGAVSAMAGARHEDRIKGMVLLYPAFVLADRAVELFGTAENIPETYTFMHMKVGREYFEPLMDYDIYEDVSSFKKDVLMIHGTEDTVVPISYSEKALESYPSAQLIRIDGAGHGFSGDDREAVIGYVSGYLQSHMDK